MNQKLSSMLAEIMNRRNIEKALLQVERNKGVGGADGMQTDELRDYLTTHYQSPAPKRSIRQLQPQPCEEGRDTQTPRSSKNVRNTNGNGQTVATSHQPMVEPIL